MLPGDLGPGAQIATLSLQSSDWGPRAQGRGPNRRAPDRRGPNRLEPNHLGMKVSSSVKSSSVNTWSFSEVSIQKSNRDQHS